MKKIIAILLALLMIMSLATPVFAATPPMQVPNMPEISKIKFEIKLPEHVYENAVQEWLAEHPFKFNFHLKLPVFGD